MRLASTGAIKRLYRQEFPATSLDNDATFQQLDLQAATPLLLVLATGMLLSALVFAVELTASRLCASKGPTSAKAEGNEMLPEVFTRKCTSQ
jgi:hypothetical protein